MLKLDLIPNTSVQLSIPHPLSITSTVSPLRNYIDQETVCFNLQTLHVLKLFPALFVKQVLKANFAKREYIFLNHKNLKT